ncbi:MAG: hydrogenase maturation protease, partial [Trueperaceae bacterium]|nr:hydrogenase maturation protease [Trueperaceae bacterium]
MATLVVGIGNDDRGDDGAGPLAARLLARAWADRPPPHVAVRAWHGDPLGLIEAWDGVERLVLIDAVVSGAAPGTCRRYGVDAPFATGGAASTHGVGLADALALARTLGRLPPTVEVWGIEGA